MENSSPGIQKTIKLGELPKTEETIAPQNPKTENQKTWEIPQIAGIDLRINDGLTRYWFCNAMGARFRFAGKNQNSEMQPIRPLNHFMR